MKDNPYSVRKAAGVVGVSTLLSRVLGFVRDVVIAWFFGAGFHSDAFFVAFRIPNLLRRLFAEGSLSVSFVSVFTEYMVKKDKTEAFQLAGAALRIVSMVLVGISLAGIVLSPVIIRVMAPGFLSQPEKLSLTILLTKFMFPYIFFIGLVALSMGILNVLGHFAAPALAPVFLNVGMIGGVIWISPLLDEPIFGLAVGVMIGGVLQLALQVPFLIKKGIPVFKRVAWYHPGIQKMGRLMLPMVFGAAVYQINVLIGTFLASFLAEGSVSYLYYADRLVQFPLGLFAVTTSTAVLPTLARQAMTNDVEAVKETFGSALKMVLFVTVPAMAGLMVLREPIVALLFKRGAFGDPSVRFTAYALFYYGMGIWAFSAMRVVLAVYYAMQDTVTPVKTAMVSVIANIVMGGVLMIPMGHGGIALSTSLASMLNFYLLTKNLRKKLGMIEWKSMAASIVKTLMGAVVMAGMVYLLAAKIMFLKAASAPMLALGVLICMTAGVLIYGIFSYLIKHPELNLALSRSATRRERS